MIFSDFISNYYEFWYSEKFLLTVVSVQCTHECFVKGLHFVSRMGGDVDTRFLLLRSPTFELSEGFTNSIIVWTTGSPCSQNDWRAFVQWSKRGNLSFNLTTDYIRDLILYKSQNSFTHIKHGIRWVIEYFMCILQFINSSGLSERCPSRFSNWPRIFYVFSGTYLMSLFLLVWMFQKAGRYVSPKDVTYV